MKISEKGIKLIKKYEGCTLTAYSDPIGKLTIGYGTTNSDILITGIEIKKGDVISKEQAEEWLVRSIDKKYGPKVMKYDYIYHWNQNQFDALCSFAYNIGSIDELVKEGKRSIKEISAKILAYDKANGKPLLGLTNRRIAEKELFDTPYSSDNTDAPSQSETPEKKCSYKGRVTARDGLNIRKKPNAGSSKLGILTYNTMVTVTEEKQGWGMVKVKVGGKDVVGWVSLNYVRKIS